MQQRPIAWPDQQFVQSCLLAESSGAHAQHELSERLEIYCGLQTRRKMLLNIDAHD